MILTFSRDSFVESIKSGVKKHTIREDKYNRWKKGRKIQFWRGNPRNIKANPYQFGEGICSNVASIAIFPDKNKIQISYDNNDLLILKKEQSLNDLAVNDGFESWGEMKKWFNKNFIGKIIFWTKFKS
ncbi:MAG: hypothetical protein V1904_06220, partial [Bacteroidota bacterium]